MHNRSNASCYQLSRTMSNEQFNQIVDAILSGKYSWACLLILRFSGYNPLHYIPYRTYNRLIKSNSKKTKQLSQTSTEPTTPSSEQVQTKSPYKPKDINYLEDIDKKSTKVKGGNKTFTLNLFSRLLAS